MAREKEIKQLEFKNGQINKFVSLENIGVSEHDQTSPIAPSYDAFAAILKVLGLNTIECPYTSVSNETFYIGTIAIYQNQFYKCIAEYSVSSGTQLIPSGDTTHWSNITEGKYLDDIKASITETNNRFGGVQRIEIVTQLPDTQLDGVLYVLVDE